MLDVPIAFLVFNRPGLTAQVFASIRAARPKKLYVIADGPRSLKEREVCEHTREIATAVDWDCDVRINFSERNLGCGARVSSGLDWVFEQCERAIILEDDCVPEPSFFLFCAELLDKYQNDERVAMIAGDNFLQDYSETDINPNSYYFSRCAYIWGWATWKRAWKNYDFKMKDWPSVRSLGWPLELFGSGPQCSLWRSNFDEVHAGKIDTWDFQWQYAVLRQNACVALPCVNLVSNIGFGESATHTKVANAQSCLKTLPMPFPLIHPSDVLSDMEKDLHTFLRVFDPQLRQWTLAHRLRSIPKRLALRGKRLLGRLIRN